MSPHVARLLRLAKVWGAVRFQHPYLYERETDWDGALARALPRVNAATSDDEEASAVEGMLAELHDPLTGVVASTASGTSTAAPRKTTIQTERGAVVLTLGTISSFAESARVVSDAIRAFAGKNVVLDLRGPQDQTTSEAATGTLNALAPHLVHRAVTTPPLRWVELEGPPAAMLSQQFSTRFAVQAPAAIAPVGEEHPKKVAFIVDARLGIPEVAAAMQAAGDAVIVTAGSFADRAAMLSETIPLGTGHQAMVRRAESYGPPPDARVEDAAHAVDRAIDLLAKKTHPAPRKPGGSALGAAPRVVRDEPYPTEAFPPLEHRVLAAFRFWNVMRLFYPYRDALNDPDTWDDALVDVLPRFEAASSALEYEQAVAALAARVHDSHVRVSGTPALAAWYGDGEIDARVRMVEGQPYVIKVGAQGAKDGLRVGDVVVEQDGRPFAERVAQIAEYTASSNPWTQARDTTPAAFYCRRAGNGSGDGNVRLRVRGADDQLRDVAATCAGEPPPPGPRPLPYRLLEEGIGYVDLDHLALDQVDPMFTAMAGMRALVLDMRGYPKGTILPLAARLNVHPGPTVVTREARVLVTPRADNSEHLRVQYETLLAPAATPSHYAGRTVLLIDERTQSAAETMGQYLEAANGTVFIGSPSAGTNGSGAQTVLPGKITVGFTGTEMRLADDRPLQRIGLQPTVLIRPTLAGVRAGKDEVLDRAVTYLRTGS